MISKEELEQERINHQKTAKQFVDMKTYAKFLELKIERCLDLLSKYVPGTAERGDLEDTLRQMLQICVTNEGLVEDLEKKIEKLEEEIMCCSCDG